MKRDDYVGVIVILVALVLITSSMAAAYYFEYQAQSANARTYADELGAALASYRSLSSNNVATLVDYNRTLSLLANAVANLNTSTPAYQQASSALSSLWADYLSLGRGRQAGLAYSTSILLDYGNGTTHWYNDTDVQPGWNAYLATVVLLGGRVQAAWYPQFQEHFVTGLNGVGSGTSNSWFVWTHGRSGWQPSETGADGIAMENGTAIAWTLCGYDSSFYPTCAP